MDFLEPGSLGGTFGGSPVACATALAVLDALDEEDLLARAGAIGARLFARLEQVRDRVRPCPIANVRGLGAMVGFDVLNPDSDQIDGLTALDVAAKALQGGLIVLTSGYRGETIRILVPLTVSDEILDEGLSILEHALS